MNHLLVQEREHEPGNLGLADRGVHWLALAVCLLTPLVYLHASRLLLSIDPYSYAQYGKLLLQGKRLYTDIVYDKGPLVAPLYAIGQLFVPRSISTVGFFNGVWLVVQALMFRRTFRGSPYAAGVSMLMIMLLPLVHEDCTWPSTEVLSNLFVVPMVLLTYEIVRTNRVTAHQAPWIGALAVGAFNVRQPALLAVLAPAVVLVTLPISSKEKLRSAGHACVGGLVAMAAVLAFVAFVGDVPTYLYMMFVFPSRYASWVEWPSDPRVALLKFYFTLPVSVLTVLLFGLVLADKRFRWLAVGGLVAGLAIVLVPKRPYPHYFLSIFPFIALWAAVVLDSVRFTDKATKIGWVGILATLATVVPSGTVIVALAIREPMSARIERIAAACDAAAPSRGTLTTWGPGGSSLAISFASQLEQGHPMGWTDLLPDPICQLLITPVEQVMAEYLDRPPDVLAVHERVHRLAQSPLDPASPQNDIRLLKSLLDQYAYRRVSTVESFHIFLRDRAVPRALTATQPSVRAQ